MLTWTDTRITINKNSSLWEATTWMELKGKFVEDCIWSPKIYYHGISDFSTFNPTPSTPTGSPYVYFFYQTEENLEKVQVSLWMRESKFTISCSMDFTWYPVDTQVWNIHFAIFDYVFDKQVSSAV